MNYPTDEELHQQYVRNFERLVEEVRVAPLRIYREQPEENDDEIIISPPTKSLNEEGEK